MAASPVLLRSFAPPPVRRSGPLGWLVGGAAALAATVAVGMAALLFAAALALMAVVAFVLVLLALALAKARGVAVRRPAVITARWTGCGWDAA